MKLYKINAGYCYGDNANTQREAQLKLLEQLSLKEDKEKYVICTAEEVWELLAGGYAGNYVEKGAIQQVYELSNKEDLHKAISVAIESSTQFIAKLFNERTQAETPGSSLFSVTETKLLEDACTDLVQTNIAEGWRIIAVCPQPQRRPDYVMGRQHLPQTASR